MLDGSDHHVVAKMQVGNWWKQGKKTGDGYCSERLDRKEIRNGYERKE